MESLTPAELAELEHDVARALGDPGGDHVDVLGYGEVSCVVGRATARGRFACKRLPTFSDALRLEAYRRTFEEYVTRLRARGVHVVPSQLLETEASNGGRALYCVQPRLAADALLPARLRACGKSEGERMIDAVLAATRSAIGDGLGLDAQLSNWTWVDGQLSYLDVTTPIMLDDEGKSVLDIDLFLASLPWLLRAPVKKLLLTEILEHYAGLRPALVDLAANLHKERLQEWIPYVLERANELVAPTIEAEEVARYYQKDARTWRALLWLRRCDRAWQRHVRRRTYPFLLPGRIER